MPAGESLCRLRHRQSRNATGQGHALSLAKTAPPKACQIRTNSFETPPDIAMPASRLQAASHAIAAPKRRTCRLCAPPQRLLRAPHEALTMPEQDHQALPFQTPADLRSWLDHHHATAPELWVRLYKKASGTPSVSWTDCVVDAIAYGWIDAQKKPFDQLSYLQRLTPRKPRSNWSKKNCEHAERLIAEGRMMLAGQTEVDAAKADGRWENAYAGSSGMETPQDFLDALELNPEAKAFFATLDRRNLYPIYYRLHTAKRPETRAKRLHAMIEQLARKERFH